MQIDKVLESHEDFSKCKKKKCKKLQKTALAQYHMLGKDMKSLGLGFSEYMKALEASKEVYLNSKEYDEFKKCVYANCNKNYIKMMRILSLADEKIKSQISQINIIFNNNKVTLEDIKKLEKLNLGYGS